MKYWLAAGLGLLCGTAAAAAPAASLQSDLERLTRGFDGRVGACVQDSSGMVCVRGGERFALQSVMKLLVGLAVLDAVDNRGWRLDEKVVIHKQDLSLYVEPIAKLVTASRYTRSGYTTTIGDLVRRAVVDSDSAAVDILVARLGGPQQVQAYLDRKAIAGVRFDRDEKHLQTEIVGIEWRPEYVDSAVLDRAIARVPDARREAAFRRYQQDPRDTATPEGMTSLLWRLVGNQLLSPASTAFILNVMTQTATFPDRLKAGVPAGWTLGHKTGTSGEWKGVTAATNDIGVLTAPDGRHIAVTVFIGDSKAPSERKAALMAQIARASVAHHQ